MKRFIIIATTMITILGTATLSYGGEYTDVNSSHWAYDSVNTMSDKSIVAGYLDGSFKPNNTVTYGEFIKMALIAATGNDVGNSGSGNWALNYYNKSLELGYFTQYDIAKEQLNSQITRGDMALIISSILGDVKIKDYDKIQEGIEDITFQTKNEYDITKAYAYGILTGYSDHTFRPDKTLSRAESATVIHRLVDENKRQIPESQSDTATDSTVNVPTYKTSDYLDMTKLTADKIKNDAANVTSECNIYTNSNYWDVKLYKGYDGTACSFDSTLNGLIYLVKDNIIVASGITLPVYEDGVYQGYQRSIMSYDIAKADYIMSIPTASEKGELVKLVVNPYKK